MKEPEIELSVRVTDGSYESVLRVPVNSTKAQREGFAQMWVNMMAQAFALPEQQSEEASNDH